jgi:rod shape-determining protein MreC
MSGGLAPVDRQAFLLLVVFELISLVLLVFGDRLPTGALTRGAAAVLGPANGVVRWVESVASAKSEATRLRAEVATLRVEQGRLVDAGLENRRLRGLLGFAEHARLSLRPVEVVGVAGEPWPVVFHLGAGRASGLAPGQAVLAPEGLVGRLVRVDEHGSTVSLITDPNAPVACEVVGTGVRGVLKFRFGTEPGLFLTAVPLTDTVRIGQRVATSATSIVLPPGIPVGRVTKVGREATGLLSEIRIEPFAPVTRLREVLVATGSVDSTWWPKPAPAPAPGAATAAPRDSAAAGRRDSVAIRTPAARPAARPAAARPVTAAPADTARR